MSNEENLPSIATRNNKSGGEKSNAIKAKDIALFAREVDGMENLTRVEDGELNKVDLESMIGKTETWC